MSVAFPILFRLFRTACIVSTTSRRRKECSFTCMCDLTWRLQTQNMWLLAYFFWVSKRMNATFFSCSVAAEDRVSLSAIYAMTGSKPGVSLAHLPCHFSLDSFGPDKGQSLPFVPNLICKYRFTVHPTMRPLWGTLLLGHPNKFLHTFIPCCFLKACNGTLPTWIGVSALGSPEPADGALVRWRFRMS